MNSHIADALFQGDMVLSKEQEDQLVDDINDEGTRSKRQAMRDPRYPGKRWHEGVNYFFDDNASPIVKSVFKKATELWKADTCIDFKEDKNAKDRVRVWVGTGCWSSVGRVGGMQNISLGQGCESVGTAAHEIGHALGFYHAHSRHDRDEFITVDVANIKPEWVDQFVLRTI
ncbi:astacin, partial [Ostertagia ostertagi]